MFINKKSLLLLLSMTAGLFVQAQYTLNSPYSKYGFGDLNVSGLSFNRGLGGTGIAFRDNNTINFLNPASYSSQDSMSFIWDFGLVANSKTSTTNASSSKMNTSNFDHIALSFPVTRKYFVSAGIIPYSKMGYKLTESAILADSSKYACLYSGSGNINQLYFGHSLSLLENKLNIGVNLQYLFGSLLQENDVAFASDDASSSNYIKEAKLSGWNMVLGTQYNYKSSDNLAFTLGLTYQTPATLSGSYSQTITGSSLYADTTQNDYKIPGRIGLGLSVQYKNQILAGIDYARQDWSKATVLANYSNVLKASNRISGGIQFVPEKDSYTSFFKRVRYRAGGYFEDSYIRVKDNSIKDYGVTVGLGIPFKRTNTMFNASLEYGVRGTTSQNLIRENYYRLNLSVSLYDFWFIKRKYQ